MPYSFTKIEEDKTKTIGLVFFFLILFYFFTLWLIVLFVKNFILNSQGADDTQLPVFHGLGWVETVYVFVSAGLISSVHWYITVDSLIPKIMRVVGAEELNPKDSYHQMFQNIIDEVSIASGGKKIRGIVIPTTAMNAFALKDFEGNAVIGATEGLLARLTRAQLEAVVGHEAAHIVSGDCLSTTVTSSMFALYGGMLAGIQAMLRGGNRGFSTRGRGGGAIAVLFIVYIFIFLTRLLGQLVNMFISREREYRADAVAVRLTRDPLSLAEALYAIVYRWRGAGLTAQELEAIFIVNPQFAARDEGEGLGADLFATHPPIKKRIQILLDMAHQDVATLEKDVDKQSHKPRTAVPETAANQAKWMVNKDGVWQGPFELVQMATFGWIKPDTWIKRAGDDQVKMASDDSDLLGCFNKETGSVNFYICPRCKLPCNRVMYEGVEAGKCAFCNGVFIEENDVTRVIMREDVGFSPRVIKIAEGLKGDGKSMIPQKILADPNALFECPRCPQHPKMLKMPYTSVYPLEINKCIYCGLIWFDKDELEVLQYLIEEATKTKIN